MWADGREKKSKTSNSSGLTMSEVWRSCTFSSFFLLFLSFLRRLLLSSDSASVSLSELSPLSPPLPFLETPRASTRAHARGHNVHDDNNISENYAKRRQARETIQARPPRGAVPKPETGSTTTPPQPRDRSTVYL